MSAENLIPDLLSSVIYNEKVSFNFVITLYHCAQLVHFSIEISFKAPKRRHNRFMTGIFSLLFEHVFTLKSLLEREKRDFDDSEIVSFQFTRKL